MKLQVYKALARGVLLESVRRKDLWVVAILGFLIMVAAGALGLYGMQGLESFAKDLAVSVLGLFTTILAVMNSSRLLPEEIKQRTLYPLLARPISRMDLLVGKLLGAVLSTWIAFAILATTTALSLVIFGVHFEVIMAQYVVAKMLGLAVLCAVTLALSLYLTPAAAATLSFILAFGGSMIVRALVMAYDGSSPAMGWLYKVLNALIPQYGLFDFGGRVSNVGWAPVPVRVMGFLVAYAAVYGAASLTIAWAAFRKKAI